MKRWGDDVDDPKIAGYVLMRILRALVFLLAACSGHAAAARVSAVALARDAGWQWSVIPAGAFDLAVARRPGVARSDVLTVYVEGDGFSYAARGRRAMDPTPTDPVALRLALRHPGSGAVAWLARPCQYGPRARNCHSDYWSVARYAPEVINGTGAALDRLKADAGASWLILVGYSGGGALVALLAERRGDVVGLVTVAANLDLGAWTAAHRLTPLSRSVDPATDAARLSRLRQVHFVGAEDRNVGPAIARAFAGKMAADAPVSIVTVAGQDHGCCWAGQWPLLAMHDDLAQIPGWGTMKP